MTSDVDFTSLIYLLFDESCYLYSLFFVTPFQMQPATVKHKEDLYSDKIIRFVYLAPFQLIAFLSRQGHEKIKNKN
jgi:hypothetical protein